MNKDYSFFEVEKYFIDENVLPFKSYNSYQIFNDKRENIGLIKQKFTKTEKVLGKILGKKTIPFLLEIRSSNGALEASISRGWISLMSRIVIRDAKGRKVGSIVRDLNLFKATYKVFNASNITIAQISGNWKEWSFNICDALGNQKGLLVKGCIGKSSDKHSVNIDNDYKNKEEKIAILTSAITFGIVQ